MSFCTPYSAADPPVLSPDELAGLPASGAGLTDGSTANGKIDGSVNLNAKFVVELESSDGVDVEVKLNAGTASYYPMYWTSTPGQNSPHFGTWGPVGYDATSGGAGPTNADATKHGGFANGRYQHRSGKRYWILVRTASGMETCQWAKIESRRVLTEQS